MPFFLVCERKSDQLVAIDGDKARKCPTCKRYTHRWEDLGDIATSIRYDWYITHDGFNVVSSKVKRIVEEQGVRDVSFLAQSNGCFVISPQREVFLDVTNALERFKGPCSMCGRLTALLGISFDSKVLEGQEKIRPSDIVRSAQCFGGDNFRSPEIIFGDEIMEVLNNEGISGGIFWHECLQ